MKVKVVYIWLFMCLCVVVFIIPPMLIKAKNILFKPEEPHIAGWYTDARTPEEIPHPAVTAEEEDPVGEEDPTPDMTWEYVPVSPGETYETKIMGVTVVFTVDKECRALSAGNKLELEVR
jgi:hypothetical protein